MSASRSTSIAAFHTAPIQPLRERVLEIIESYGVEGCITDDVIAEFRKTDKTNTGRITGRFSELENEGRMLRVGDTRVGALGKQQLVMRHFIHAASVSAVSITAKKAKRNPFLKGMMEAAKIMIATDPSLRGSPVAMALKAEIMKAARR